MEAEINAQGHCVIDLISGPLVVSPQNWTLAFSREAATRWASWLALGPHKHVRAYAYVPFLHVWVFVDPHIGGHDITIAADGEPALLLMASWRANSDLVRMPVNRSSRPRLPVFGWCVPVIRRLLGVPGRALRPSAFYRDCLRHGGQQIEPAGGSAQISAATA